jgi:hypothetical protein
MMNGPKPQAGSFLPGVRQADIHGIKLAGSDEKKCFAHIRLARVIKRLVLVVAIIKR